MCTSVSKGPVKRQPFKSGLLLSTGACMANTVVNNPFQSCTRTASCLCYKERADDLEVGTSLLYTLFLPNMLCYSALKIYQLTSYMLSIMLYKTRIVVRVLCYLYIQVCMNK